MGSCSSIIQPICCCSIRREAEAHRNLSNRLPLCPICENIIDPDLQGGYTHHISNCLTKLDESRRATAIPDKNGPYIKKCNWFRSQLRKIRHPWMEENLKIPIKRENLVESSIEELKHLSDSDYHKEFEIEFLGEIAVDAGGLQREWFNLLMNELFSKNNKYFRLSETTLISYVFPDNPENIPYEAIGKIIGKAFFEGIPISCSLSRVIFKHLVNEKVDFQDLVFIDDELYQSLSFILENPIEEMNLLDFQIGEKYEKINDHNKSQLVEERVEYETKTRFEPVLEEFLTGIFAVVPKKFIEVFSAEEAELALCGLPYIDIDDWQINTRYRGGFHKSHTIVIWFWEWVRELSSEELETFLVYVTGTSRVPIEGFSALQTIRGDSARFTLESMPIELSVYPKAHTCFNRLDLPLYICKEDMVRSLEFVLEHAVGFGIE